VDYSRCPKCGNRCYEIISVSLLSSTTYEKEFKCRSCGQVWLRTYSLLETTNVYKMISLPNNKTMPLHRWVLSQIIGEIDTLVVHHLNHEKSDNSTSNLIGLTASGHAILDNHGFKSRNGHKARKR